MFRRTAGILAIVLGVIGVIACLIAAYGVWRVQARLDRANDSAFDIVARGVSAIEARMPAVRARVQRSKITADDVGAVVKRWASAETRDRVVTSLEIESRATTLSNHLQAADDRLDASAAGLQNIRQLLEVTELFGDVTKETATGQAQDAIAAVRTRLQEAQTLADEVQRFASDGGGPVEDRLARVTTAIARIALTLSDVDGRLNDFEARLGEIRSGAQVRREHRSRQLRLGAIAVWAVLIWIAVAMMALAAWGRK